MIRGTPLRAIGGTPLDDARRDGHVRVAKILEEAGVKSGTRRAGSP